MGGNISVFGFNMGAKMGEFGIFESNVAPTPPIPQPKYLVVNISLASGTISGWVSNINTTGVNISNVTYETSGTNFVKISFDGVLTPNDNLVYCEAFFNETWYAPTTDSIPLFQVLYGGARIDITPIDFDKENPFVDGDFQLSVLIFE